MCTAGAMDSLCSMRFTSNGGVPAAGPQTLAPLWKEMNEYATAESTGSKTAHPPQILSEERALNSDQCVRDIFVSLRSPPLRQTTPMEVPAAIPDGNVTTPWLFAFALRPWNTAIDRPCGLTNVKDSA
jgi:hypothetical protein